ncbi:uncharacterized protein At2g29880-like [Ziziphus jujuba]|uniref:Uncharacterized protein At2g29880-like n=1 Tax=Ziziphus jujuba TaxID=326968 RepID=A0ABM4A2B9_ZIZJJ|nr:uncharacterized protein At2g29880-like [Ziziphus jujuba]
MVDAANRGWRDNNSVFSKLTVESKILPTLNEALGCNKNYSQYQSRLKWFKTHYQTFSQLMCFNSGFGWDATTQRFTATDEIWDNYFKSHPNQKHLRTDTFADFEDLKIAVGNGTAIGKNSIGLGDDTDAKIYGQDESTHGRIDDYVYDEINENATRVDLLEKLSHGLDSIGKIATEIRDNIGRYKALALIQKMGVKDAFLKMLPEERSEWISFNME